ncbi:peptide/nickel transport system substrate-binding protein [Constrictibacter sp. MBR-5]|jgi:peptide/nickel transport system substrate-binding protein|uniref:ABC transporter substrate-binding protein n=1 Tax=Constrictibacter sp. MBR-5 TaxID=3156467 RepID=UPI0033955E46
MPRITRRGFIATSMAAGALAATPRLLFADSLKRPTITIAVQQVVNSGALEPLREQSNVGARIFYSIFDHLIDADRQGDLSLKPGLATEWKRIDEKTLELKLRRGVKFHNGDEMTAEDVAFSWGPERMFGTGQEATQGTLFTRQTGQTGPSLPPEVAAVAKRLWPALDRIEIVDKYTVRLVNKVPDVTLEGRLARASEVVSKRAFLEAGDWPSWARKPVGTGPYRVAEFKPDNLLVLEAFDEHWLGRPPIARIRFVVVPEVASRINGLLSGEYDFITDVPPDQIATVERDPRYEVVGGPILNHRLLCFAQEHPVLADPRIRRAMTHSIDRQLIVDSLFLGRTTVPKGLQWDYYGDMLIRDWTVPAFDPALAKSLLKEAGYKGDPIPYRVLNNYYTNQVPTSQILIEMWREVGLNVQIEMKENWQQIFDKSTVRGARDWSNSAPFSDPVSSLVNQHGPRGQQQQVGEWTNAEFNKLSGVLESSTDLEKRRAAFRRMLEIAEREDPGYTVLHQTALFYGKRKDIAWTWSPRQSMDFRAGNFAIKA